MEPSTTIKKMLARSEIFVPSYQRSYSWNTLPENKTQTDVFLSDLEQYIVSCSKSPYYFGHFLFEKKDSNKYGVVDGQQRLTTIVVFLAAIFKKLKTIRELTDDEIECYKHTIKRNEKVRFSTVDYDNQIFRDYIIDHLQISSLTLTTESSRRFIAAFNYFEEKLSKKSETELKNLLNAVINALCTTHVVSSESEAIQMFIFQNDRGKKPSNLEIIKAQFMYNIHLYAQEGVEETICEIKNRFEAIYKSISLIERKIDEDDVLLYTLKVFFNSLWRNEPLKDINSCLYKEDSIAFIKKFSKYLETNFKFLCRFLKDGENEKNINIHSLIVLGATSDIYPFILKSYEYNLNSDDLNKLCGFLENILLRSKVIGTRADLTSRINDVFNKFDGSQESLEKICSLVEKLKTDTDYWWNHWNNRRFEEELQGNINYSLAKYILWKYENFLLSQGKKGYLPIKFSSILEPHLEHIAPRTENNINIASGYCEYDDDFKAKYLESLGNYLLLSGSHNCSIGNNPLSEKLLTYKHLEQQREIVSMVGNSNIWDKTLIIKRKDKIIDFLISHC